MGDDKQKPASKFGRKRLEINVGQLRDLASHGWKIEAMAAHFGCSRDTLERRYAAIIKEARLIGAANITEMLYLRAKSGSDRALLRLDDRFNGVIKQQVEVTNSEHEEWMDRQIKEMQSKSE